MRLFVAALGTETNTFSPIPTGLGSFEEYLWFEAGMHPEEPRFFTGPIVAARRRAAEEKLTVIEGLAAFAAPAGLTTRRAWETLRDRLLDQLRSALPVEIVLLSLHGAMVADGCQDFEGDLLAQVRALVGADGAELDPHCHLTETMVRSSDLLVFYKEYPHTDTYERAEELVDLALRAAPGDIRPLMGVFDCRMIATIHTTREPGRGFVSRMKALEGQDGVLPVSLGYGFP
jgi:microcystin degradation protein MlrC